MALFVPDRPRFGTLLVLILLSFALMIADRRSDALDSWIEPVASLTLAIQQGGSNPLSVWSQWRVHRQERAELVERLRALEQENFLLKGQMHRFYALTMENRRLTRLLGGSSDLEQDYLLARKTANAADPTRPLFVIDRGLRDDVQPGHPVVDDLGLVGQVVRSTHAGSEVLMLHAANHAVSVTIGNTGHTATLSGSGDPQNLIVRDVPDRVEVSVGDMLVSSGLDGAFPAGYPVARVREIRNEAGRAFFTLIAEPAARIDRVREVLVLMPQDEMVETGDFRESTTPPVSPRTRGDEPVAPGPEEAADAQ
ncbi:MAG: rod shape-determining protein MreC [Halothiobacillaceae bacterium]